ncbi:response regulator [Thiohalorhabdus sp. Cl-TMA]|uniref:histidine kinase n=1 Tax=Thiohalorhabdus methylotrophus TaxID=3242694 RepID=A0ABV4TXD0_9GAMM
MASGFDFSAFIAGFQEEAEERLHAIESTLVDLEKGGVDADQLERLRRDAHSVKGSANMLQLRDIGETAHVLEDAFAHLRDGTAAPHRGYMELMFELLDALRSRIGNAEDPESEQLDPEALRARLERLDAEGEAPSESDAAPVAPEATPEQPDVDTQSEEMQESAEAGVHQMDWSELIPGLRQDAEPVLHGIQEVLGSDDPMAAASDSFLDQTESLAMSMRQVGLEDAAEALDLVAAVLESPAVGGLPASLGELLQNLVHRVRRRLEHADQPDAQSLDRKRIRQARGLLEQWGMVQGPSGERAPSETLAQPPDPSETPESVEKDGEVPAIAEPGAASARSAARSGSGVDVSAFLEGFQAEALEELAVIQDGLLKAEQAALPAEDRDEMRQKVHSLKGSANMLGLEDIGGAAEILEDGVARLDDSGGVGVEALLSLHDALRATVEQVQDGERTPLDVSAWAKRMEQGASESPAQPASAPREPEQPGTAPGGGQKEAGDGRSAGTNRGTLRVSADRLERLSEGVIGLAMDRATQEDRRAEMDQIIADFRALRRQWEWFEGILPESGPLVQQQKSFSNQLDNLSQSLNRFRQETELEMAARHGLYDEIHERVMALMVSPLGTIFSVLPRSARDLAQRFQKRVELSIEGSEIELERKNVDALLEPLVHLVTNAISHGIEAPEEREAAGKSPVGRIRVQAEHVGGEVAISVTDDGRGIDYEKVRETAIRTGVTTAAEAESMLPYDLLQMLFRPGFSTKEEVNQISGRGIGMNAVRDAVQRMTGSIQVDSEVGRGTTFTLNIPVSTAVQRVLKFRVGEEVFGVLANQVERILGLHEVVLTEARGQRFFHYQGNQVPATWLSELFGTGDEGIRDTKSLRLVVVRHLEGYIGLVVHEVLEEAQAVVKDVTNYLRRHSVQGLIGTTISGSGEVQLLLEPTGIKEMERTSPLSLHMGERWLEDPLRGLRVLLVEDSPLARQMERAVLENAGMEVDTAVDGLDALDRMEVRFPDIVITDVEMPRMDGYDLLRKLRDDNQYRGVPVFMVTSRDSEEDRGTAQHLGADGFLNKMDLQSGDLIGEIRNRLEQLYA